VWPNEEVAAEALLVFDPIIMTNETNPTATTPDIRTCLMMDPPFHCR